MQDLQKLQSSLQEIQPSTPSTYNTTHQPISETPPSHGASAALLDKTLSVVRYIPFIVAGGLFLFKAATWIILLGVSLITFGAGLSFFRSL